MKPTIRVSPQPTKKPIVHPLHPIGSRAEKKKLKKIHSINVQ